MYYYFISNISWSPSKWLSQNQAAKKLWAFSSHYNQNFAAGAEISSVLLIFSPCLFCSQLVFVKSVNPSSCTLVKPHFYVFIYCFGFLCIPLQKSVCFRNLVIKHDWLNPEITWFCLLFSPWYVNLNNNSYFITYRIYMAM